MSGNKKLKRPSTSWQSHLKGDLYLSKGICMIGNSQTIMTVTNYCIANLNLKMIELGSEYHYASMPLCAVDSVFSIGVNYRDVIKMIDHICKKHEIIRFAEDKQSIPPIEKQLSTSDFLNLLGDKTYEQLANDVFCKRWRTSTKNGILKTEALIRFLKVLQDFNAEYFQDVSKLIDDKKFEVCIKNIPGQRSGISLKYFFMLAGSDDIIKPDRMILRFLQNVTGRIFTLEQCQSILHNATNELNKQGYVLTPKLLDHIIWKYQREIPSNDSRDTNKELCERIANN